MKKEKKKKLVRMKSAINSRDKGKATEWEMREGKKEKKYGLKLWECHEGFVSNGEWGQRGLGAVLAGLFFNCRTSPGFICNYV